MAILINDTTPRVQYTATSGQTVFTVSFEFFENADLKVYKNSTLLTLTTHYTVTGAGVTGGGSITLVTGATAGDILTITRDIAVKRVTDFPTSGPFNVDALNTDLDRLTAMMQERENGLTRVVQLSETDAAVNLQLPVAANRSSKVLGFDSTGNAIAMQEIGTYLGNWTTPTAYVLRDIVKDTSNSNIYICVTAHTSAGSQPISSNADSAKWALIVDAAAAATSASNAATSETNAAASAILANDWATKTSGTVAGGEYSAKYHAQAAATSASNASTSASNADTAKVAAQSAQSAAESARDATLAAYDSFDDRYLGTKASDPSVDNDGNALIAGALYFNSTNSVMKLYTGSAWVAAYVSGSGYLAAANNLSDLQSAATARTNLGLGSIATQTAPSGSVVGTTDTQTLTNKTIDGASNTLTSLSASNLSTGTVAAARFADASITVAKLNATGTPSSSTFLRGDGTWNAPAATGINVQTFTGSGTWTKPSLSASSRVLIQAWGGGASGAKAGANSGGGGGGGYNEWWFTLSALGATETVTIGAGGTARSTNGEGNSGGNTTVGSLITAYGGGGGGTNSVGGGGGGQLSAGGAGNSGYPRGAPGRPYLGPLESCSNNPGAAGSGQTGSNIVDAVWHGGGGGAGAGGTGNVGGFSVMGGGGGGGYNSGARAGGTSTFGGNGGASGTTGVAGTQPGGGGGGSTSGNSGAGAAGQVIITVFPA